MRNVMIHVVAGHDVQFAQLLTMDLLWALF